MQTQEDPLEQFTPVPAGLPLSNHPAPALCAWINAVGILPNAISGQSLRYFRSGIPVCVILADPEAVAQTAAHAKEGHLPGVQKVIEAQSEWKIIVQIDELPENVHVLLRPSMGVPHQADADRLTLSVDRLRYDLKAGDWVGDKSDLEDLASATMRVVSPETLTTEHAVQLCSLSAMLEFDWDKATEEKARYAFKIDEARSISRKFMSRQFKKIVTGAKPSRGFLCLDDIGALEWFLPELAAGRGLEQNRYHRFDIFYHSIYSCDAVAGPDLILRLAALFHDFGKVDTRKEKGNGEASFHNHELVSTRHAERILRRFHFDPWMIKRIKFLVRHHMFHYTAEWTDRAVRRFMSKVAPEVLSDLITVRLADRQGSGKRTALPRALKDMIRHINTVQAKDAELKTRDLAIDGHALMQMGMSPGPDMGRLLRDLLDRVKSGELVNEKEALLIEARRFLGEIAAAAALVPPPAPPKPDEHSVGAGAV